MATTFLRANVRHGLPQHKPDPVPVDLCGPVVLCPTPFWAALEQVNRFEPVRDYRPAPIEQTLRPDRESDEVKCHLPRLASFRDSDTWKPRGENDERPLPNVSESVRQQLVFKFVIERIPLTGRIVDLVV